MSSPPVDEPELDIFLTRDICGNESDEPVTSDEEDELPTAGATEELSHSAPDTETEDDEDIHTEHATSSRLRERVLAVLQEMDRQRLPLGEFLDAVSWSGDEPTRNDAKIRAARTNLFKYRELPNILRRWAVPPRSKSSHKKRPVGGSQIIHSLALEVVKNSVQEELRNIAPALTLSAEDDVHKENLSAIRFNQLEGTLETMAPTLWEIVQDAQRVRNRVSMKKRSKMAVMIISMISYSRSHKQCRVQKLLSLYFNFKGLSAKGFDTLHAMGITMSHKWTSNSVARISAQCMHDVQRQINLHPWLISYDNINISFRVFSQRLDNNGEFGSGTAATVYIKPDAHHLPDNVNQLLKEKRASGMKNPLTDMDIYDLAEKSYADIEEHEVYQVLRFLLDCPEFDMKTYDGRKSDALTPPKPLDQLPCGPEHAGLQYLLGTVPIPEASYEDNARLVEEWLAQLGWDTKSKKIQTALKKLIAWIGDQLTMDRLRGIFKQRAEEENSFERLDFSVFIFGWLHLQMAFANSLHKQYEGSAKTRGLRQAFELLNKKGLGKVQTKGVFYHDLNEALLHVAEAHFRQDWLELGRVESLAELRRWSPEALVELAKNIVRHRASSDALDDMKKKNEDRQDDQLAEVIQWNRDILQYIILQNAIKDGDVGMMEALLPHLLLRFVGSGNNKYAGECLELLQGLHREWPAEVCDFVRHHAWLINTTGKPGMFCPIDMAQEHNIKDIKVTYRSEGPNVKWEYMKKLHPAIHTIRAVARHVEEDFGTLTRGMKHGIPDKELDVRKLQESYRESGYHRYQPNRKTRRTVDYLTTGIVKIPDQIRRWTHMRSFERKTSEVWEDHLEEDEVGVASGEGEVEGTVEARQMADAAEVDAVEV